MTPKKNYQQVFGSSILLCWLPVSFGSGQPIGDGVTWEALEKPEPKYTLTKNASNHQNLMSPETLKSDEKETGTIHDPNNLLIVHHRSGSKKK